MKIALYIIGGIVGFFVLWLFIDMFRLMEHTCDDCIFAKKGKCLHDGYSTMKEGVCWDFRKKRKKKPISYEM
jgi:hypothetical protein